MCNPPIVDRHLLKTDKRQTRIKHRSNLSDRSRTGDVDSVNAIAHREAATTRTARWQMLHRQTPVSARLGQIDRVARPSRCALSFSSRHANAIGSR